VGYNSLMAIIKEMLLEEYQRLKNSEKAYINKINSLPKGSIRIKKSGNNNYYYLKFRKKDKTITQYVKNEKEAIKKLSFKIRQRKKYESILKEIKKDLKLIEKIKKHESTKKNILGSNRHSALK
jgi:hypothetical protein